MATQIFTIEEANQLIPQLEIKLLPLLQAKRELGALSKTLESKNVNIEKLIAGEYSNNQALTLIREKLLQAGEFLKEKVDEIQKMGCFIKDLDLGLVDFVGLVNGKEVSLCWQLGESEIAYYHGLDEGFTARKPIFENAENKIVH